jgi:hypothetical protein
MRRRGIRDKGIVSLCQPRAGQGSESLLEIAWSAGRVGYPTATSLRHVDGVGSECTRTKYGKRGGKPA